MTNAKTQDLLKKINYIEADIEIQKQILFSIPSDQKAEMETTIGNIAAKKKEIASLREQIQQLDPAEAERILVFENAVAQFKKLAAATNFQSIVSRNVNEECTLALKNGKAVECLIKACDGDGNWTVITLGGKIEQFPEADVTEKPKKENIL
jgi:hypothetical protein